MKQWGNDSLFRCLLFRCFSWNIIYWTLWRRIESAGGGRRRCEGSAFCCEDRLTTLLSNSQHRHRTLTTRSVLVGIGRFQNTLPVPTSMKIANLPLIFPNIPLHSSLSIPNNRRTTPMFGKRLKFIGESRNSFHQGYF